MKPSLHEDEKKMSEIPFGNQPTAVFSPQGKNQWGSYHRLANNTSFLLIINNS